MCVICLWCYLKLIEKHGEYQSSLPVSNAEFLDIVTSDNVYLKLESQVAKFAILGNDKYMEWAVPGHRERNIVHVMKNPPIIWLAETWLGPRTKICAYSQGTLPIFNLESIGQ